MTAFQATYAGDWADHGASWNDIVAGLLAMSDPGTDLDRLEAEIRQFLADRRQFLIRLGMAV